MSSWWRRSAVDIDTLSWLTSSMLTTWLAAVIVVYASSALVVGGQLGDRPALQLAGILVMAASAIVPRFEPAFAARGRSGTLPAVVFAMIAASLALSALGVLGTRVQAELWWAPLGAALVVTALSPVVPGRVFLPGSIAVAVVTIGCAAAVAAAAGEPFPIASAIVAASATMFAAVGGCLITASLIRDVDEWRRERTARTDDEPGEPVVEVIDGMTGDRLSGEIVPFLRAIESGGVVTAGDRQRAAALARGLRDALVDRAQQDWLAAIVRGRPLLVSDPLRLAESLTLDQRSAITALVDGVFGDAGDGVFAVRIELAAGEGGAVRVAMTIDLALPEGRRTSVLAPYYLTVKSVVRRIEWRNGESLVVAFDLDPDRVDRDTDSRSPAS